MAFTYVIITSLLCGLVIGGLPYDVRPAPVPPICYPKTVYVTVEQDIYKEIPVASRVVKTELIPSRFDLDQPEIVYQDHILTSYAPQLVTTTVHIPIIDYITNYDYVTITKPNPVVATVDQNIPALVTEVVHSKVVKIVIHTDFVEKTDVVPVYRTKYDVVYDQIRNTKVVPILETVHDTKIVYKTLCPDLYY